LNLKVESVVVVSLVICIFLSFYFAYLSFQTIDETLKKQLVMVAVSSLITGIVIFASMAIYLGIRGVISRVESQLPTSEETEASTETQADG